MMAATSAQVGAVVYFGKVPSRGDFIKGAGHTQLIATLDRWLSSTMESLATDPHWKRTYDAASPLHFAFVGPRSRNAVIGHLSPSHDASHRRFPFLAAASIEAAEGVLFRHAPAHFSQLWGRFKRISEQTLRTDQVMPVLTTLQTLDCQGEIAAAAQGDPLGIFLRTHTLAHLERLLGDESRPADIRRIFIALGILLSPLAGSARVHIEKGLSLPLPADPMYRDLTAALWMSLVAGFLARSPVEVQVLVGAHEGRHRLVLGFNGATAAPLLSLLAPNTMNEHNIALDDPDWIETHPELSNHYGIAKLSSCLCRADTALSSAVTMFNEVFLGE
ncbi:type VI secretion system-associated protein TagF [Nitrogeniibacter mangrovi]|uniref:Type VI secretion system-associated protein TagF n=1 Tax=Nitrogeniibacter mangrovi TaxID=2016596 RepID=A0A6C1B3Z8_9RHOO|nr:type VI secretion system-associated protein TagF [Nitrogeniibacter mangrovi]QID18113.1 type VI secretion system-associated protein TagF [Nitrogeniibacter mangrovi]